MHAHRADATVSGDGSVTVRGVPFAEGERVEVVVLPRPDVHATDAVPLRGSVRRYERPFDAAEDEWDAA